MRPKPGNGNLVTRSVVPPCHGTLTLFIKAFLGN
jgi:hypothetical protein